MTTKRQRLTLIIFGLALLGGATGLALAALRQTVVYFQSPTELVESPPAADQRLRVGGIVTQGSVTREPDGATLFVVGDGANEVTVRFVGVLPDLFREGQGIVAEGRLAQAGLFQADEVLAKHDENYMPAEVADALRAQGVWQGD